MTAAEMKRAVESNLGLYPGEKELLVSDVILSVCDYCNLHPERIPDVLEQVVRKKVKGIIDYEAANGSGYHPEVASLKEGDGTITWAQTKGIPRQAFMSLMQAIKRLLKDTGG